MWMFVTKTLTVVPVYKAFGTSRAAQRWAESGAYLEHSAEQSEIYRHLGFEFDAGDRCRQDGPFVGAVTTA